MEVFVLNSVAGASASILLTWRRRVRRALRVITLFCARASSSEVLNVVYVFLFSFSVLLVFGSSSFFQFSLWKKFPDVPYVEPVEFFPIFSLIITFKYTQYIP